MTPMFLPREARATKRGTTLTAWVSHTSDPAKKQREQTYQTGLLGADLRAWFDQAAEGAEVNVVVHVKYDGNPEHLELRDKPVLAASPVDTRRADAVRTNGGFINPYTFVPALPRTATLSELGLGDSGDDGPPSHARITAGQWSGVLRIQLTCVSPLLIPDTQKASTGKPAQGAPDGNTAEQQRLTFDTRTDATGMPYLAPTSLKGVLRSSFETITASRYGIFPERQVPLAYRVPTSHALELVPAVIGLDDDGNRCFRLCRGDSTWSRNSDGVKVLEAAWVPAHRGQSDQLILLGGLRNRLLTDLHGVPVSARLRLYEHQGRGRQASFRVWRATHLSDGSVSELRDQIDENASQPRTQERSSLTLVQKVQPRTESGILSITGNTISAKHDERFFVYTNGDARVPVSAHHREMWNAVLGAYQQSSRYGTVPPGLVRSQHVTNHERLVDLPTGTPVYVMLDEQGAQTRVTEVHPVMIGRKPFDEKPSDLLDASLRPARSLSELSPADRLFGWVPQNGPSRTASASGYRGRLKVGQIHCLDRAWKPDNDEFPPDGVILAPLSSPKPTQFRFYAAKDDLGTPFDCRTPKDKGYGAEGGLRGRKMYRWSEHEPAYWHPRTPTDSGETLPSGRHREYQDLTQGAAASQTVRYRSWVKPGTRFVVELRLDGVPEPELGALIWLLSQGGSAPLRIGAGKPLGFGVMETKILWDDDGTELWDGSATVAGWKTLARPEPTDQRTLENLADRFHATATRHPVLAEAIASYLAAAAPVTGDVHYPRLSTERTPESYQWFVENEKTFREGWSLPHVRDDNQQLPFHGDDSGPSRPTRFQNLGGGDQRQRKPPAHRSASRKPTT